MTAEDLSIKAKKQRIFKKDTTFSGTYRRSIQRNFEEGPVPPFATKAIIVTGRFDGIGATLAMVASARDYKVILGGKEPLSDVPADLRIEVKGRYFQVDPADPISVTGFGPLARALLRPEREALLLVALAEGRLLYEVFRDLLERDGSYYLDSFLYPTQLLGLSEYVETDLIVRRLLDRFESNSLNKIK